MVQEYGESTTANLIAMGKTCVADVTESDLRAARGQTVFPFEENAGSEIIDVTAEPDTADTTELVAA